MANRISGITVEIGGDVGPLSRALESCNKMSSVGSSLMKTGVHCGRRHFGNS